MHRGGDAGYVDGKQPVERGAVDAGVVDGAENEDARIIDEDIESPELLGNRVHEIFDLLGVRLIGLERLGVYAFSCSSFATASALSAEAA